MDTLTWWHLMTGTHVCVWKRGRGNGANRSVKYANRITLDSLHKIMATLHIVSPLLLRKNAVIQFDDHKLIRDDNSMNSWHPFIPRGGHFGFQ